MPPLCQSAVEASNTEKVKSLTTNNEFCIVQKATAQSKTGIFHGYGMV
jgi:hypothetical protein